MNKFSVIIWYASPFEGLDNVILFQSLVSKHKIKEFLHVLMNNRRFGPTTMGSIFFECSTSNKFNTQQPTLLPWKKIAWYSYHSKLRTLIPHDISIYSYTYFIKIDKLVLFKVLSKQILVSYCVQIWQETTNEKCYKEKFMSSVTSPILWQLHIYFTIIV